MDYLMVSTIYVWDTLVGYRLLSLYDYTTIDSKRTSVLEKLKQSSSTVNIVNLELRSGEIVGVNGAVTRYAMSSPSKELLNTDGSSPLVIVSKIGDTGYRVSDYKGSVKVISKESALAYAKKSGIANGKIVPKGDIEILVPIYGEYPMEEPKSTQKSANIKSSASATQVNSNMADELNWLTPLQKEVIKSYYKTNGDKTEINWIKENISQADKLNTTGKCYLISYIIHKVSDRPEKLQEIFGKDLAQWLIGFIGTRLPMTESLIDKAYNTIPDNKRFLFYYIYPRYIREIESILPLPKRLSNILSIVAANVTMLTIIDNKLKDKAIIQPSHLEYLEETLKALNTLNKINDTTHYELIKRGLTDSLGKALRIPDNELNTRGNKDEISGDFIVRLSVLYGFDIDNLTVKDSSIAESAETHLIDKLLDRLIEANRFGLDKSVANFVSFVEYVSKISDDSLFEANAKQSSTGLGELFKKHELEKEKAEELEDEAIQKDQSTDDALGHTDSKSGNRLIRNDLVEKPESFTEFNWLRYLLDRNEYDSDYSITIAEDILNKNINTDKLSARQKYRVTEAIKRLESINRKRLGVVPSNNQNNTDKTVKDTDNEENKSYSLEAHPEIEKEVKRVINAAKNSRLVKEELDTKAPLAIKICYSIIRYKKASTKQLKHVKSAIEVLNNLDN